MSHFLTFVIVPPDEPDPPQKAHELLYPYFDPNGPGGSGNPLIKCDGFVIGGRFDQELFDVEPMYNLTPAQFQERYGFDVVKAENNIRLGSDVPKRLIPDAIVTPEGSWLDCENRAESDWESEVGEVLQRYGEYFVVAVDCHC